jgi:hypothetical protein
MKTDILNWRMWLIGALAMVSLICIVSEPIDDETWWSSFFISKGIGSNNSWALNAGGKYRYKIVNDNTITLQDAESSSYLEDTFTKQ